MNETKIQYLQMIQEVIARMSNISLITKGFFITIAVSVSSIIIEQTNFNFIVILLFIIPLLSLVFIDCYYLSLERKYRHFYKETSSKEEFSDFSLELPKNSSIETMEDAKIINCLKSKCILLFYLPILVMYVGICVYMYISKKIGV